MKVLLHIGLIITSLVLIQHGFNISDYYSVACGSIVGIASFAVIRQTYRRYMRYNTKCLNPYKYKKHTKSNNNINVEYFNPNAYQEYYKPLPILKSSVVNEIAKKIPLSTSIISYTTAERVSKDEPTKSELQTEYVNEKFLAKVKIHFVNTNVTESLPISIDNDDENSKLSVPLSELNTTYTVTTSKTEVKALKLPFEERFTPYKAKIYNDIINVISNHFKSFVKTQRALNSILYIECSEKKIILYIRQSTLTSPFNFPFQEITQEIHSRMGSEMEVDFAPISTLSISEYFIQNLNKETSCQQNQTSTNTNVVAVGTKSLTQSLTK